MRIVVDTGVFSASLSSRRRARFQPLIGLMAGHQLFLAAATVSELRYGALVAGWGEQRRQRLEESMATATVVPVTDSLLTGVAELRHACRQVGHPLHERSHANDLWIAASAIHVGASLLSADAIFDNAPGLIRRTSVESGTDWCRADLAPWASLRRVRPAESSSLKGFELGYPISGIELAQQRGPDAVLGFGDVFPGQLR